MNKKIFIPEDKLEVSQISLTGARSLALIGLLVIAPRTFDEIKKIFIDLGFCDEKSSGDIFRIDLNTIKSMGCDIARPCSTNGYKYIMKDHPYALNLDKNDAKLLKRIYTKVKENASLEILIGYDDLFRKLAEYTCDEEAKELLLGISILKYYNVNELKEISSDCEKHKKIELVYKNIATSKETIKKIKAQKFVIRNNKLYLYGYDLDKQDSTVLHYKRIQKIISRDIDEKKTPNREIEVIYRLKDFGLSDVDENEQIISITPEEYTVQGIYHNDFIAMQRVLSFGSKCIVDSPLDFREKVIKKLKEMRDVYNG